MDDPAAAKHGSETCSVAWRLLALALALWGLTARSSVGGEEILPLRRLPPLAAGHPDSPAPSVVQPSPRGNAGPALLTSSSSLHPSDAAGPILRLPSVRDRLAPARSVDRSIQLISLQEPAVGAPAAPAAPEPPPESEDSSDAEEKSEKKKDGEAPTYGRRPESNALQFLRTQDVLLAQGAWQFDTGLVYAHFNNDFPLPVLDPSGAVVDVVEGLIRRRLLYTPLAVRYGLTRNVQLFATMPMGFSNTQISTVGSSDSTTVGGSGDLTLGASVHLLKAEDDLPDVIATMDCTAPTGAFSTPIFGLVPGSNLGQGFWAMSGSLLFIHRYDPVIVFYGAGFRHLFERTFDGSLFSPGEQIAYQFGVGFSINDRVTLSTAFQGFYITDTQLNNQTIQGTNLEPLTLRFAATIARRCKIIEPFCTVGLTDSAPAANVGIVVTFY